METQKANMSPSWEYAITVYLDFYERHLKANTPKNLLKGNREEILRLARSYDEVKRLLDSGELKDCRK
jgi:hypothetical protein